MTFPIEYDGNMLLDYILGADIRIREPLAGGSAQSEDYLAVAEEVAAECRSKGHRPYVVSVGGSKAMGSMTLPLGAISYVQAFIGDARTDAGAWDSSRIVIVHSTGSGATQAGLIVGAKALAPKTSVVGISVSDRKEAVHPRCPDDRRGDGKSARSRVAIVQPDDVIVFDEYIRDGYGIVNKEVADVIRLMFTREGIVLDPVYTSKAFVGLVDLIRKGYFKPTDKIVFFHTGGTPALFRTGTSWSNSEVIRPAREWTSTSSLYLPTALQILQEFAVRRKHAARCPWPGSSGTISSVFRNW